MNLAPIVLFVYNRPWHTEQTLNALSQNDLADQSVLYVYADGPKKDATEDGLKRIQETRQIVAKKKWCKEVIIIESNVNNGLANSVINGVTEVFTKHDKIIVLEDDLITARNFLRYMNAALNKYTPSAQVMEIAGFSFEANGIVKNNASFFLPITTSWGWGTWKRVWNKFDIRAIGYEKLKTDIQLKARFDMDDSYPYSRMLIQQMETTSIDSWAIRFWWHVFKNNGITLFPDQSLIKNIGYGTDGTHTSGNDPFPVNNFDLFYSIDNFPCEIKVNEGFYSHIKHYFRNKKGSVSNIKEPFLKKIILYLKKWGI